MHYILGALCKIHTFAKKWTPLILTYTIYVSGEYTNVDILDIVCILRHTNVHRDLVPVCWVVPALGRPQHTAVYKHSQHRI